jgi:hypothetical protein
MYALLTTQNILFQTTEKLPSANGTHLFNATPKRAFSSSCYNTSLLRYIFVVCIHEVGNYKIKLASVRPLRKHTPTVLKLNQDCRITYLGLYEQAHNPLILFASCNLDISRSGRGLPVSKRVLMPLKGQELTQPDVTLR